MNGSEVYLEVVMLGFVGVLLMNINTSMVFYWSLISGYYIRSDFRRGVLAASSLVGSLVGSSFIFSLGSSSLSCSYSFTAMVLELVGLLESYTLHISPLILSNLNGLVHLPLCLMLPFCYMSMFELSGSSWIVVMDELFYWFSTLLTYFFVLILAISFIAFFMAAAYCVMEGTSSSSSLI